MKSSTLYKYLTDSVNEKNCRPPLEYIKPVEKLTCRPLEGVFDGGKDYNPLFEDGAPPKREKFESKKERIAKDWNEKILKNRAEIKKNIKTWNPHEDENILGDPYKTLFICRMVNIFKYYV